MTSKAIDITRRYCPSKFFKYYNYRINGTIIRNKEELTAYFSKCADYIKMPIIVRDTLLLKPEQVTVRRMILVLSKNNYKVDVKMKPI